MVQKITIQTGFVTGSVFFSKKYDGCIVIGTMSNQRERYEYMVAEVNADCSYE
jgi:hypothetical protein